MALRGTRRRAAVRASSMAVLRCSHGLTGNGSDGADVWARADRLRARQAPGEARWRAGSGENRASSGRRRHKPRGFS